MGESALVLEQWQLDILFMPNWPLPFVFFLYIYIYIYELVSALGLRLGGRILSHCQEQRQERY